MASMRIGEVAKRAGIGIETIRFYERKGLLREPARRASGYRQYDESVVSRLEFIVRAKGLGFTLSEIRELLALRFDPVTTCCDVRQKAERKIEEIETRIASLQGIKRALKRQIEQCLRQDKVEECPILYGLTPYEATRSG